jgi:hypothetical protein
MPTTAEYTALKNAVNTTWTADYQGSGIAGMIFTDKTDSSKTLFFPAAGSCSNGSVNVVGNNGYYWYSSLYILNKQHAYYLYLGSSSANWGSVDYRFSGYTVRPVIG